MLETSSPPLRTLRLERNGGDLLVMLPGARMLPVFVGHRSEDCFAGGMAGSAERFPQAVRHTLPGGHEWPVWERLWEHFLGSGLCGQSCEA